MHDPAPSGSPTKNRTSSDPFDFTPLPQTPSYSFTPPDEPDEFPIENQLGDPIYNPSAFILSSPCPSETRRKKTELLTPKKRKRESQYSSKECTSSKPAKRVRRDYNLPSAALDIGVMVSNLMQQEFRRRARFEDKMVELASQKLEETRAIRREIASFIQEYHRRSLDL